MGIALTMLPSWPMVKSRLPKQMGASGVHSTWEPPSALMVVPRFLGGGGRAFGAVNASPSPLKGKSSLSKWTVVPGGQLSSRLAIWSLDNLIAKHARPYLARQILVFRTSLRQVNLLCVFWAPEGMRRGHKIYIGSGRTFLRPIIGGLRYRHN
jgi:hypothetical protein